MKIKRLWEYEDLFLMFCKIFVPRSEGPPLKGQKSTIGNGEYATYQYFLLFENCFQKPFTQELNILFYIAMIFVNLG